MRAFLLVATAACASSAVFLTAAFLEGGRPIDLFLAAVNFLLSWVNGYLALR